jgi:AraC-like DNA-binding protein
MMTAAPMPERRLLAAIVNKALRDVEHGSPRLAGDALAYINGPNLEADCDWLGIPPAAVRAYTQERILMSQRALSHEQVLALHARYTAERLSIEALAREAHTAPATLSRAFAAAGLPVRKRGEHQVRRYPTDIRRLSKVLSEIAAMPGVTSIRVTFELSIDPEPPQ